jgi:beta-glucosidase
MTVEEKIAQLQGIWIGAGEDGGVVAPEMDTQSDEAADFTNFAKEGLGQLTRVFGTKPISPSDGLTALIGFQKWIAAKTRLRIGLQVHEECLTGLSAWTATTFPTPIAWAATFDPEAVEAMGSAIGQTMAQLGIHQGLAPVLDVVRDARWGRVEETMGEDPYVIGTLGKGYVEGLQSHGVVACLKHFAGYSNSRAGRNLAPVHAGPREIEDVFLPPFEIAVLDGHVGSVMPAYIDTDGVPAHGSPALLTDVLRDRWGFEGIVVSDYFGVAFLLNQHGVVGSLADAALKALKAGVDVELPTGDALRAEGVVEAFTEGSDALAALDTAVGRVLMQKEQFGLLDIDGEIARLEKLLAEAPESLDPAEHRAVARRLAEESVILLDNKGILPVEPGKVAKIAVVGPNADRQSALFGCYSFVNHVLMHNPDVPSKIEAPTILEAIKAEYPDAEVTYALGCTVRDEDRSGFDEAIAAAKAADVVFCVVGDQAGLFGKGTSGEGCDTDSLDLPGVQTELVEALLETGTDLVLVPITGRPYAIGALTERAQATVQAFFPGEEGSAAVAGVLSGRINPSGHLPVSVPRTLGVLPYSYLHPKLGDPSSVSSIDTTPQFSFGHGLSYTSFTMTDLDVAAEAPTDGWITATTTVTNTGDRAGATLVQLYGHDVVASTVRPLRQLIGYARVELEAGQSAKVTFKAPVARFAFHDDSMERVVEPGAVTLWLGSDCDHPLTETITVELTGPTALVTSETPRLVEVVID